MHSKVLKDSRLGFVTPRSGWRASSRNQASVYSHVCLLRWQNAKLTNGLHRTRGHVHKSRAAAARAAAQKSTALAAAGGATGGVNGGGGENFAFQVKHMSHCHLSDTVILNLIT